MLPRSSPCPGTPILPRTPDDSTGTASSPDNGSAFTSRGFRARLAEHGVTHRRGGYRDPESQAFIESWFGKLKERLVWRSEFEKLDQARKEVAAYIDAYHHRPHSGLRYRTPAEVRKTWEDGQRLLKQRPEASSATGSRPRSVFRAAMRSRTRLGSTPAVIALT